MSDRYQRFAHSAPGRVITAGLGLPKPAKLRRYSPDEAEFPGPVLLGGTTDTAELADLLSDLGIEVDRAAADASQDRRAAAIFDATTLSVPSDLAALHAFFRPAIRRLAAGGRVVVIGRSAQACGDELQAATQAALDGFIRSVGKELRAGGTANLLRLRGDTGTGLSASLRFFLSGRSAFVSGQVVEIDAASHHPADTTRPLQGKTALVTGAARGIGAVTAEVLARDGAEVVGLDVPVNGAALESVTEALNGQSIALDLATAEAAKHLSAKLKDNGGIDIVVHNAGLTRDKTLAGMDEAQWNAVLDVNLAAPLRVTDQLLEDGLLRDGGRVVVMSSVMGIAGNRGQANYAASKAGLIGMVRAISPRLAERHITANAVAPGFIDTDMTARMPLFTREAGRRLSSLVQGGQPVDVAETIAWLAHPGSAGISGQVVRVCGQSLLGA